MNISEEMVREIILEVLQQMQGAEPARGETAVEAPPLKFRELGQAKPGTNRSEVVVGIPPAFGTAMTKTIIKAVEAIESMRAGLEDPELRSQFMGNKLYVYEWTIQLLHRMNRDDEAFHYLERARARLMLDMLSNKLFF